MAKTQWNDGSDHYLTPALAESFWGNSATTGHTHDGLDVDGSMPKIDPVSEISGSEVGSINIQASTTCVDDSATGALYYRVIAGIVSFRIIVVLSGSQAIEGGALSITPVVGEFWPMAVLVGGGGFRQQIAVESGGVLVPGLIQSPSSVSAVLELSVLAAGVYSASLFTSSKGFPSVIMLPSDRMAIF